MLRRRTLKLPTPADIRRAISRIANIALNAELDPKRANTLLYACNAAVAAMLHKCSYSIRFSVALSDDTIEPPEK